MKKILSLLLVLTSLSAYAQKSPLRLHLQKDSTYYLDASVKMNIDEEIQATHQTISTTIKGTTAHKIVGIQDTLYIMSVVYKSISMNVTFNGRELEMTSEGDTSNMFSKIMHGMLNQPFDMVMSNRGEIIAVKNFDRVVEAAFAGIQVPEQKKEQVMAQLRQSFGEKSIKGNLQQSFIIYPKRAIGVKDMWTDQTPLEAAAISAKIKNTYTLDNITADNYEISAKSLLLPDKAATYKQTSGIYMRLLNISGTFESSAKVNKTTGWVSESNAVKHIKANAEVKRTLTATDTIVFPMTIDATIESTGK